MVTTVPGFRWRSREPLAALGRLTVAALVGIGLMIPFAMFFIGGRFDPMGAFFTLFAFLMAGLVAGYPIGGWRWAPLVGTVLGGLLLIPATPFARYGLSHPADSIDFAFWALFVPVMLIAMLAGIGATVQNYRSPAGGRRAPRWLAYALIAVAGLCSGAILVAAIPQAGAQTAVSGDVLVGLPVLAAANVAFDRAEIHARVGETVALRLENTDRAAHSFDIDELNVHTAMPPGKSGLALFKAAKAGSYAFYCAVPTHRQKGMVGTLIVEP